VNWCESTASNQISTCHPIHGPVRHAVIGSWRLTLPLGIGGRDWWSPSVVDLVLGPAVNCMTAARLVAGHRPSALGTCGCGRQGAWTGTPTIMSSSLWGRATTSRTAVPANHHSRTIPGSRLISIKCYMMITGDQTTTNHSTKRSPHPQLRRILDS